jgi:hypothetical protein
MNQKFIPIQILLICVIIYLVGCKPPPVVLTPIPSVITVSKPTASPTYFQTVTPHTQVPTFMLPSTPTSIPSATPTLMPPTWTPLPTLSLGDARNLVANLLENNAGCLLPCWWGIVPGETTWQEAYSMLAPMAIDIGDYDLPDRPGMPDRRRRSVDVPTPQEVPYASVLFHAYITIDGIVAEIEIYNYDLAPAYFLPAVLNTYGIPDGIWIRTFCCEDRGSRPFVLDLFYSNQGLLFEFSGGHSEDMGDTLRVYPQAMDSPFIYLWDPRMEMTCDAATDEFLDVINLPHPLPLQEAAGMDVETFYNYFSDPNSINYLETPDEIWPP